MATESKNYELAYLLSPSVPEEAALTWTGKLTNLITDNKGVIRRVNEPRKKRLAYPVKKANEAYFGYTTFSMAPGNTHAINKMLKADKDILRYLLTEEEIETRPPLLRPLYTKRVPPKPRPILREPELKPEEKLDLEALDKKLEEILGK